MIDIPTDRIVQVDVLLVQKQISPKYHCYYRMWVRSYLAFCRKQGVPEFHAESLDRFMLTLAEQGKAQFQQRQAAQAVAMYFDLLGGHESPGRSAPQDDASGQAREQSGRALPEAGTPVHADLSDWKQVYAELFRVIRARHYSQKTLKTYTTWLRHFQGFTRDKKPAALTAEDVKFSCIILP